MSESLFDLMAHGKQADAPLNVIDEDADKCCRNDLEKALQTDAIKGYLADGGNGLRCRKCGQEFRAEMIGTVRYWRCVPQVHIVRPR